MSAADDPFSGPPAAPEARRAPRLRLYDRWLALRDKLLQSPRFHSFAAAFPATRPLARRRARDLFDLCAGFVYSQTLLACVRLKLFDHLADGPRPLEDLAESLGLAHDAALRLLRAAISLRLVSERGGESETLYGLGELGAALRGAPGVIEMVEHHALLYADLADPVALLRGEADPSLRRYWSYVGRPAEIDAAAATTYSNLMSASLPFVAEEVLDAYPLHRHRHVLDVGGGDGTFLRAAARRAPKLQMTLFDLPAVVARAKERFAAEGLASRVTLVGGSFFDDLLPTGADAVTLIRVAYDHDDASVLAILRNIRAALPPDGVLVLAEPMAGVRGAEPIGDAYFGFYLLAMGGGRPRTPADLTELLRAAGFGAVRLARARRPLLAQVLVARPS